jgi:hypothetical protein
VWVRAVATVPSNADAVVEALGRLTPDTLATLAQAASHDGCHLRAYLARPVRRGDVTTLHLRWWHERDRSLSPAVDGELELRPMSPQSTTLAITARYRCREALRELANSMFLRRMGESVVKAFLNSLVDQLVLKPGGHPALLPAHADG